MIDIVAARPSMTGRIALQKIQLFTGQEMTAATVAGFIAGGMALAAVDGDEVLCIAGLYDIWPGRALAWALLSERTGRNMVALHRVTQRALDVSPVRRVEAYVFAEHDEGHRWLRMLGFAEEGLMRQFWQGQDYTLYARVR